MYGAQTLPLQSPKLFPFENDVEMYGAQTNEPSAPTVNRFENDVEMYGAQTWKMILQTRT